MTLVLRSGPLWERPSAGKGWRLGSAKHRAGSNIPRSAHPSAVRAVAEPASHSLHLVKAEIGRVGQHNPAHNGLNSDIALCRRANFRLMRRNKRTYSITSSARPSSGTGISRPSDFAVFMLTTTSSLVTRCTPPTRLGRTRVYWPSHFEILLKQKSFPRGNFFKPRRVNTISWSSPNHVLTIYAYLHNVRFDTGRATGCVAVSGDRARFCDGSAAAYASAADAARAEQNVGRIGEGWRE